MPRERRPLQGSYTSELMMLVDEKVLVKTDPSGHRRKFAKWRKRRMRMQRESRRVNR